MRSKRRAAKGRRCLRSPSCTPGFQRPPATSAWAKDSISRGNRAEKQRTSPIYVVECARSSEHLVGSCRLGLAHSAVLIMHLDLLHVEWIRDALLHTGGKNMRFEPATRYFLSSDLTGLEYSLCIYLLFIDLVCGSGSRSGRGGGRAPSAGLLVVHISRVVKTLLLRHLQGHTWDLTEGNGGAKNTNGRGKKNHLP